ncbi:BMP family ABC transporter substrate-binding protein [Bradyrhizobium sp. Leo121]|uniref:BMP family ABC transporter substrate-binding protein n=1 Tax=Bradyrhizobium sp. Leo121 TaxID=1571195 RepID=UPI001A91175D
MWSMATAVGLAMAAPVAAPAAEPLKVAFVYLGPRSDGGWTQQHDLARLALEKAMGSAIKTTFVENVPETADSERVFRQLAADGNKLIFATSFGYMEPLQKVAKLFPDVKFEHVNGFKTAANITVYEPRFEEGFYLIGTIAGLMTKTNTLGFIGSFPIPSVMRNINAMALGAQAVNPKIKVKPIWVNTWYDPGKERQAADTLIAQGADNVAQNTDSPASIQAAQEKGTYAFSIDADMSSFGKKAQLSGSTEDWSGYYIDETKKVLDGTWTGNRRIRWGLKEGLVVMAPLNPNIPPEVVKVFEEKKAAIIAGTLNPFAGPIKDNTGKEMVPAGGKMSEATFSSLNWYVEGVEGTVPK